MDPTIPSAQYINLITFRKDGREVATPLWFAALDGKLYAYTLRDTGKLKRLRATKRVKVAACDMRGRTSGPWSEGMGRIVEDGALAARAYVMFGVKYGWIYRLSTLLSRMSGKYRQRVLIELAV